ncbi:excinuclease ABC [Aliifodinibius salipaludis]|uniref:Excinuclease ABC n=1 Tax=Fodinibius salipaludis TaxID=2032627 RepID=A0A2A2GF39_9BACT|nr:excinuclease ABC [Aliifodinibius salipaludis]PAU95485.1 excinuclease ABC [Aliifodinibius salipaludis]
MSISTFSQSTIEKIKYYVYILMDPRNNMVFYVGKGRGNRIFSHINNLEGDETDKISLIKEIQNEGYNVKHYIIRRGLSEESALRIESALIDVFTHKEFEYLSNITNINRGFYSFENGISKAREIENIYSVSPLNLSSVEHNLLLININKNFNREMSLYEATRKYWRLNMNRVKKVDFVLSEYRGIIRAIFKPEEWYVNEKRGRKYFKGFKVEDQEIKKLYLNKIYEKKAGNRNPINYLFPN